MSCVISVRRFFTLRSSSPETVCSTSCVGKRTEPDVPVDFAVDDDASEVEAHGDYRVKPFDGDPGDEELLRVAEALHP